MEVLTGPYTAAVGLLFAAGVAKAWRPAATARALTDAGLPGRGGIAIVLGAVEVVVAATAAVATGPVPVALVAVCYLGFAGFVALGMRRGTRGSCGCFGAGTSVPPGVPHLIVNLAAAAVAVAVALAPPAGGLAGVLGRSPLAGLALLAATAVCGWLAYLVLSALPEALAGTRSGAAAEGRTNHERPRTPAPLPGPVRLQPPGPVRLQPPSPDTGWLPGPDAGWLPGPGPSR